MRDKNFRRFQERKKKNWAKKILQFLTENIPGYIISNKEIGRRAHTPKPCSCDMCGNPRHHKFSKKDQLTIQEKREYEKFVYRDDTYIEEI
jgi:hypothetical protein